MNCMMLKSIYSRCKFLARRHHKEAHSRAGSRSYSVYSGHSFPRGGATKYSSDSRILCLGTETVRKMEQRRLPSVCSNTTLHPYGIRRSHGSFVLMNYCMGPLPVFQLAGLIVVPHTVNLIHFMHVFIMYCDNEV